MTAPKSLFALIALASLAACSEGYQDKSAVVATVNGTPITQLEYDHYMSQPGIARNAPDDTIEQLVMTQLFVQEALKQKLDHSESVYLATKITRDLTLVRALFAKHLKDTPVTEEELKARYAAMQAQQEIELSHILVGSKEQADKLLGELGASKNKKTFATLARKHSLDIDSGKRGGVIAWANEDFMLPELFMAAQAIADGAIADKAIKSRFGWHILRRERTRARVLLSYEQLRSELKQRIQGERIDALAKKLRKAAKIKITETRTTP